MASILVVDGSASVQETLRIVLGTEYDVVTASSCDELPPELPRPDVVVLGLPPLPRDERAIGAALARTLAGVPLVLLHSASEVDVQRLVGPTVPVELVPKLFDAHGIRRGIRSALRRAVPVPTRDDGGAYHRRHLEVPFLPALRSRSSATSWRPTSA